jgi:PKD repeat protein
MRKMTLFFILACFLIQCKKEDNPTPVFDDLPYIFVKIDFHNRIGNFCFTDTPVRFMPQSYALNFSDLTEKYEFTYRWDFGDGSVSDIEIPKHSFNTPGEYQVSLKIAMPGDILNLDTVLSVTVYPEIPEKTPGMKNGKFLFQTETGDYSVLYTNRLLTLDDDWYHASYANSTFATDAESKQKLVDDAEAQTINSGGNLVVLSDTWFTEYLNNGSVARNQQVWDNYFSISNYSSGYLLTGTRDQKIMLRELNSNGESISSIKYELPIQGFYIFGVSQTMENEIFIHYIDSSFSHSDTRPSILRRISVDGNVLWQKDYDFPEIDRIHKLTDGYLLYSNWSSIYSGTNLLTLTRIDNIGNVIWRKKTEMNYFDPIDYIHAPSTSIFENNGQLTIFFDNMRCIKIDNSGQLVFERYYGLDYDVFNCAIKNKAGNYVVMGTRGIDYLSSLESDYNTTDLMFIEINEDGDPVK